MNVLPSPPATADSRGAHASPNGKTYGLFIGISKYAHVRSLQFADTDAESMAQFWMSPRGGMDPANALVLVNDRATRAGIDSAFRTFVQAHAGLENSLVIFFAGGCGNLAATTDPVTNRTIEDPFLFTYDSNPEDPKTTGYPMAELRRTIAEQALIYRRVMVFLDSELGQALVASRGNERMSSALQRVFQGGGVDLAVMGAAGSSQRAYESANFGGGHGAFTYFLIYGLDGAAVQPGSSSITWADLASYVRHEVAQFTNRNQTPFDFSTDEDMILVPDIRLPGTQLPDAKPLERDAIRLR